VFTGNRQVAVTNGKLDDLYTSVCVVRKVEAGTALSKQGVRTAETVYRTEILWGNLSEYRETDGKVNLKCMLWQMGYKYARCTELYRVTSI
jgi:hypothetical protein